MQNRKKPEIWEVCARLEKAALATKNDRVFNILIGVSSKLERQVGAFAPKLSQAELTIIKMYLYD